MTEDPAFLAEQLISYRGNKRKLLGLLEQALILVKQKTGPRRLRIFDGFSGSGVCSRFFKQHAALLISNDLQPYAKTLSECFLTNRSTVDLRLLAETVAFLEQEKLRGDETGFFERLYAPENENEIKPKDRVYFTRRNAHILDRTCQALASLDPWLRPLILGPLLAEVSRRSNTAGHFKGFLKNKNTGIGQFGGAGGSRAERMMADVVIRTPVLSAFECEHRVFCRDVNEVVCGLGDLDVAYFDPPYDDQPYGALYWMLNLLVCYEEPSQIAEKSGKPRGWTRSGYTRKHGVEDLLRGLIENTPAPFILLSYSNESKISPAQIADLLASFGTVECLEQHHRRFNSAHQSAKHGVRGLRYVRPQVIERLYVLEKR